MEPQCKKFKIPQKPNVKGKEECSIASFCSIARRDSKPATSITFAEDEGPCGPSARGYELYVAPVSIPDAPKEKG